MTQQTLTIVRPDDWHLHLRDGAALAAVVGATARQFARAVVMPNLKPPVTTVALAQAYRSRIDQALQQAGIAPGVFTPLMTLYLTDNTSADESVRAKETGAAVAVKLYPAGATTNSDAGVTVLLGRCMPVLEAMQRVVDDAAESRCEGDIHEPDPLQCAPDRRVGNEFRRNRLT